MPLSEIGQSIWACLSCQTGPIVIYKRMKFQGLLRLKFIRLLFSGLTYWATAELDVGHFPLYGGFVVFKSESSI